VSESTDSMPETAESAHEELGPIQLLVIGFSNTDLMQGEVLDELVALEERGTIRVLDLLYVEKTGQDELVMLEIEDLEVESSSFGGVLSSFLGLAGSVPTVGESLDATIGGEVFGISGEQARASLDSMQVGAAASILLFEHIWAIHFRDAARRAGGFPVLQGFLTQEAVLMIGAETRAIRDAAVAMEIAEIVEGAAMLDALEAVASAAIVMEDAMAAVEQASAVEAYAAARAVRALIAAGVIEQYAAEEAINALQKAGLLLP